LNIGQREARGIKISLCYYFYLCPVVPALLIFIPFGPSPKRQGLIIRIKKRVGTFGQRKAQAVFILILTFA